MFDKGGADLESQEVCPTQDDWCGEALEAGLPPAQALCLVWLSGQAECSGSLFLPPPTSRVLTPLPSPHLH